MGAGRRLAGAEARRGCSVQGSGGPAQVAQRAGVAVQARQEAEATLKEAQQEHDEALAEEEQACTDCNRLEATLAEVDSARSRFQAEALSSRQRREQLKTEIVALKGALRPARAAEKEATAALQAVSAACSKVERAQRRVAEAKAMAVD